MRIKDVKGLVVLEFVVDEAEEETITELSEEELIARGKEEALKVLGAELVKDAIVGFNGSRLQVAVAV